MSDPPSSQCFDSRVVPSRASSRSLRSDFAGVRAGFFALLISSGGDLVTGLTLASITNTLTALPGSSSSIPAAIGMRGNIFGGLGSRLGTQIHAGTFRVSRRVDTLFGQNVGGRDPAVAVDLGGARRARQGRCPELVHGADRSRSSTSW